MCNPLLSQQVGSWGQQRPAGEQQTVVAQIMTNAPVIVTTVAPVTPAFYRDVGGSQRLGISHILTWGGEQEEV